MAKYYISAKHMNAGHIEKLKVHQQVLGFISESSHVETKTQVIIAIGMGHVYTTITWDYHKKSWTEGAVVHVVKSNNKSYLRTVKDNTEKDNLDHLIDF